MPATLHVTVDDSYTYRARAELEPRRLDGVQVPVRAIVEDLLFGTAVEIVVDDGTAEAHLHVALEAAAIGHSFWEPFNDYLYTGATVDGVLVLEQGGRTWQDTFEGVVDIQFRLQINRGYENPVNAPFEDALARPGGLYAGAARLFARAWGAAAIEPALEEPDPAVRLAAVRALAHLKTPDGVPALARALDDDDEAVRWQAAWGLGRTGDERAVAPLIEALSDPSSDVRWFAAWSLRELTGAELGTDPEAWRAWQAAREN